MWLPCLLVAHQLWQRVVVEDFSDSEGTVFESMIPLAPACARARGSNGVHLRDHIEAKNVGPRQPRLVRGWQRQAHQPLPRL